MKTNLYELQEQGLDLVSRSLQAEGDEEIDALFDEMDAWAEACGSKLLGYKILRERSLAEAEYLREEAAKMAAAAQRRDALADKLTARVLGFLEVDEMATGKRRKFDLPDGGWVRLQRRSSVSVEVDDGADIADDFLHPPNPRRPDKKAIRQALERGLKVPGARLVEKSSAWPRWS